MGSLALYTHTVCMRRSLRGEQDAEEEDGNFYRSLSKDEKGEKGKLKSKWRRILVHECIQESVYNKSEKSFLLLFCLIALELSGPFLLHNSQKRIPGTDISYPLGRSFHSPCILLLLLLPGQAKQFQLFDPFSFSSGCFLLSDTTNNCRKAKLASSGERGTEWLLYPIL